MKKAVIFGAGKIGRSFIGQLFSRSGYEVVFIDKDRRLVDALNRERSYRVHICDRNPEVLTVNNVRGLHADDRAAIAEELASADVAAVSVGIAALPYIVPALSEGLLLREKRNPCRALDIIIAENMRNADLFLHGLLSQSLPAGYPLDGNVGLVETSIGKMVPFNDKLTAGDILSVAAEAYNTLIAGKQSFKNPIPDIAGLEARDNMKAWVDRKLFIHNFGHAAAAYFGFLRHPRRNYLWEALEDPEVGNVVKAAMTQSAEVLRRIHPGVFTPEELQEHIDDLLLRFSNVALGDTVFRVGCDLYRKLSPEDRIVAPLTAAIRNGLPHDLIVDVLAAALRFKAAGADGKMFASDEAFHAELEKEGVEGILKNVCGFSEGVGSDTVAGIKIFI